MADDLQEGDVRPEREVHGIQVYDPTTQGVDDHLDDGADVGEVPALGSVAVDRQGLALEGGGEERRDGGSVGVERRL